VDPKYGEAYRGLFEKHWWWRSRNELIVDKLRQLRPASGWERILDIGCGDGLFFDRLAEFGEVEGVEPVAELVSAHNPHRSRIYICPFDDNFRPGKQYSLILMLDVLEHLENPAAALRHVLDLLSRGGTFVATVPAFMSLWTNHDVLNHHFIRYTKATFRALAQQAGLQIREQRYLYHWMFPAKLSVGFLERMLPSDPVPAKVPSNWLNTTLYWLSRVEQRTISHLPVPFGSSLMVVGGKRIT
jgi:2-polyprenyl-3-methyl-5-hydroxy-6-metoxy-1,4-benzoquinol methylase